MDLSILTGRAILDAETAQRTPDRLTTYLF